MSAPTRVKRARPDGQNGGGGGLGAGTGNVYLDPPNQGDGAQFGTSLADFATAVTGGTRHWLATSDAERSSMASKRMRLEELVALNESTFARPVKLPIIMPASVGQLDPKLKWTIRPSSRPRASMVLLLSPASFGSQHSTLGTGVSR